MIASSVSNNTLMSGRCGASCSANFLPLNRGMTTSGPVACNSFAPSPACYAASMSRIDRPCGLMFRLTFWSDDTSGDPAELSVLRDDPAVRARFGDRPLLHVGAVNELAPLWVENADPAGPVYCRWMMGGEYALEQVADRRSHLTDIAELLELLWGEHRDAYALPFDEIHRSTAREVLDEIARANPASAVAFWRFGFFRQYDIHIRV